jgi:hypothetical protein
MHTITQKIHTFALVTTVLFTGLLAAEARAQPVTMVAVEKSPAPVQAVIKRVVGKNPLNKELRKQTWKRGDVYKADYKVANVDHVVAITFDGQILKLEKVIPSAELPAKARTTIKSKYPKLTYREVQAVYATEEMKTPISYVAHMLHPDNTKLKLKVLPAGDIEVTAPNPVQ